MENVYYNIEQIYKKLMNLDEEKDKVKYLALSCIYGAFLGDSMGSFCEFTLPSPNNHDYIYSSNDGIFQKGEVTDDSEMAISAAFAYMDMINSTPDRYSDILYYYFCIWQRSCPKDIGMATTKALEGWNYESIENTKFNYKEVKAVNWNSLANGFLMRISTFIAYYYYKNHKNITQVITNYYNSSSKGKELTFEILNLLMDIQIEASENVVITHPNTENIISCAVFCLLTLAGMVTKDSEFLYQLFELFSSSEKFTKWIDLKQKNYGYNIQKKYKDIIMDIKNMEYGKKRIDVYDKMGYYIHAFKLCIYYLRKYKNIAKNENNNLYKEIIFDICDFGGDTDTNAAIVGTMIGPLIGYKKFPKDYFQ
jgi:ADP-ribosylglycohydrolase